jgi:hypothetical protein
MFAAINETAKTINPLSISISNGILRSTNLLLNMINRKSEERAIDQLALMLKLEYPKESQDYVRHMAIKMYEEVYK